MASSKRTTKSIIVSICINRDLICCGKFYITSSIGFMFFFDKGENIYIYVWFKIYYLKDINIESSQITKIFSPSDQTHMLSQFQEYFPQTNN